MQPREVEPGSDVRITFSCRDGHQKRIEKLQLISRPELIDLDVTSSLDRKTGKFALTLPGKSLDTAGKYDLRLSMTFTWEDGKTYHRSPPFGTLTIRAFAGHQYTPQALDKELASLKAEIEQVRQALAEVGGGDVAKYVLPDLVDVSTEARRLVEAGNHPAAKSLLVEMSRQTQSAASDPARTVYVGRVARFVAGIKPHEGGPVMSILTGGAPSYTEADYQTFRELGIGIVARHHDDDIADLHEHGFQCVSSTAPVRLTQAWLDKHPEHRQHRYLVSNAVKADSRPLALDPLHGFLSEHYDVDTGGDPARYWRVLDATDNKTLDSQDWQYVAKAAKVIVAQPVSGHDYRVVVLVQARDIPFFHRFADPLYPGCLGHILRRLDAMFVDQKGLDVYRPTSLFYPFPKFERYHESSDGKPRLLSWHNFYGYQWGTSPFAQRQFTEQTGTAFDPLWMVDGGRYGDVNYPPTDGYSQWMAFHQRNVETMTKQVVDVAHRHQAKVRVFWGDHWLGMEPHANNGRFFKTTGMDQIVKACGSAVVTRMTVDIPADVTKIIRFSPWFSQEELFSRKNADGFMETRWGDIKRGALFRMPDGFTWGGETQTVGFKQPRILAKMKSIANEFRLMHELLSGEEVFRHDLTVYVVNAWGDVRPWAGWSQINESQMILDHLTDLPINVRFLSLANIARQGVPEDADVLINAGEPHSSWSGGFHWTPQAVQAVEQFVANGGGLIGIGAPSHNPDEQHVWQLAPVLGVDFADSVRVGEGDRGSFSKYDSAFLDKGPKPSQQHNVVRTGKRHFVTEQLTKPSDPLLCKVRPQLVKSDVTVLCSRDGKSNAAPLVTSRLHGKGRAIYISGYSQADDYSRILRRAIFWSADREKQYGQLIADNVGVRTYWYPAKKLLVVYNESRDAVTTSVRLDPALFGVNADRQLKVVDLLADQTPNGLGRAAQSGHRAIAPDARDCVPPHRAGGTMTGADLPISK